MRSCKARLLQSSYSASGRGGEGMGRGSGEGEGGVGEGEVRGGAGDAHLQHTYNTLIKLHITSYTLNALSHIIKKIFLHEVIY